MRVTVIGTGYVGLVTGTCLAYLGHSVTCIDSDEDKVRALSAGDIPIYEPHLSELLVLARQFGNIEFASDPTEPVAHSDIIFIAVGTPSSPSGAPDLKFLEAASRDIGRALSRNHHSVIVNKSTVPVGSGNLVAMLIREGCLETADEPKSCPRFSVVSNPEFLQEGNAIFNSLYPDRIVIGADQMDGVDILEELYRSIAEQSFPPPAFLPRPAHVRSVPLVITSLASAEMIKYAANSFLAMKISFANEMANICERVGAECSDVMRGIGLDARIGEKFLNAGVGYGGSCFGKDLQALTHTAQEYGYRPLLLEATQEVNRCQRQIIIQKLQDKLRILKGRTIGLLGLAFKPETDDLRDAPSLTIAARLLDLGARVKAYDPIAMSACRRQNPDLKIRYCDSPAAVAQGSDALVVVTEWNEFRTLDLKGLAPQMVRPILIDGRNVFSSAEARRAGFEYSGLGSGVLIQTAAAPEAISGFLHSVSVLP